MDRMSRKKGEASPVRVVLPYKTLPRLEILFQIYHSMAKEFQRDISFRMYQVARVWSGCLAENWHRRAKARGNPS